MWWGSWTIEREELCKYQVVLNLRPVVCYFLRVVWLHLFPRSLEHPHLLAHEGLRWLGDGKEIADFKVQNDLVDGLVDSADFKCVRHHSILNVLSVISGLKMNTLMLRMLTRYAFSTLSKVPNLLRYARKTRGDNLLFTLLSFCTF